MQDLASAVIWSEKDIEDEAEIASRVGGAEKEVLYLGSLLFESDDKKLRVSRLAVIKEEISCKAVWRW